MRRFVVLVLFGLVRFGFHVPFLFSAFLWRLCVCAYCSGAKRYHRRLFCSCCWKSILEVLCPRRRVSRGEGVCVGWVCMRELTGLLCRSVFVFVGTCLSVGLRLRRCLLFCSLGL